MSNKFWTSLDDIVNQSVIEIDRPQGSVHPKYPDYIYPYDYGLLHGTISADGEGIDVWVGSAGDQAGVTGVIVTIDGVKRDSETKILLGCNQEDSDIILSCQNRGGMAGILIMRC